MCLTHRLLKLRGLLRRSSVLPTRITGSRPMSNAADDVLLEEVNNKGVLTLNRPKALNALNLSMINKILPALLKWENEKRMVLVKGAGDKAFCAGGDVRAVTVASQKGENYGKEFFKNEYYMNHVIGTYNIPYIAVIDGITMGGGIGLSVHGKYRIATERTLCAMPETAIGLFPDVGGSYFLPRLQGKLGAYLALTGYRLSGVDNLIAGVATHFCKSSDLPALEKSLLEGTDIENILAPYAKPPLDAKFTLEPVMPKINAIFSAPTMEELFSRLKADGSKWAEDTLAGLKMFSPLSMKIALKELELGATMSLQECLQMEYRLACRACEGHDFIEGVRALLVDKDKNPKWKPPTIEEVSQKMLDDCFSPLSPNEELKLRSSPRKSSL